MERIGIMAESGRGKTTLMKLLLNFIKPQKGNILLDGIDIKEINHRTLRERIKYINQKTLLLNDTIIDNFKYGNNKTTQQIIDFLKKYNLEKLFPDLETIVDMNGKNISMGMQKIIYLVRNILNDKCCVYIFDEPLTSLDENTRDSVIKMIDENTKNKTVIVITHDKQILKILNRVINL
jgi:ATP-binding cassette subfamily B protein